MTKLPCACDTDGDQLSLLCLPVAPKKQRKPVDGVRYAAVKPKTHTPCADCIADIHARGVAVAPYPRPVRWRRTDADGPMLLCEMHKDARQEREESAKPA